MYMQVTTKETTVGGFFSFYFAVVEKGREGPGCAENGGGDGSCWYAEEVDAKEDGGGISAAGCCNGARAVDDSSNAGKGDESYALSAAMSTRPTGGKPIEGRGGGGGA